MDEWDGVVWVVEKNHKPLLKGGRIVCFPCGGEGTNRVRAYLNTFPTGERDYYDAVLYESRARKRLASYITWRRRRTKTIRQIAPNPIPGPL